MHVQTSTHSALIGDTQTTLDHSVPESASFALSMSSWKAEEGTSLNRGWADTFSNGLKESNPYCSFSFKRHWVKKSNSRKRSEVAFKAQGYCTFSNCSISCSICISTDQLKVGNENILVSVQYSGEIEHDGNEDT